MDNKNILIINLTSGLCNQLNTIAKSIILAEIFDRNIYFKSFQIHYNSNDNKLDFNEIINIDKLQENINKLKLNVKIHKSLNINPTEIIKLNSNNQKYEYIKDYISLITLQKNVKYLNIECPISALIPEKYKEILDNIVLDIHFTDKFIHFASRIKETFNLNNYICVHLRMEDDCLNYMSSLLKNLSLKEIENIYKDIYTKEFEKLSKYNVKIYICTSLGIYENNNNQFYKELKKKYNLIDKNDLLLSIDLENNNYKCRELYGIIDYLVAKDSTYFVGCDWSSFSILLYNSHMFHIKNTTLLNLWNSCLDKNNKIKNKEINK
jgi:hypothetical protein